ncbi:Zn-dependent metalloprotease [Amycolatopsis lexingtonensis]|uniref:Neutral metalloproteinase n=1 Tax=Amycolatopsis lexingtonensis TaxID=218822 RepID=A0ABR9HUC5_9PSEU|nr:M4 family metallopeptidase [Amycolatopsis lexingtonensis]MBE1494520.1 Zn-dependent metalloprotease [Amycolatopsis lexingtonensis]
MSRKRVIAGTAAVSAAVVAVSLLTTGSPAYATIAQPSMHALNPLAMPFGSVLRSQQEIGGVPVFGGQLVQVRDKAGAVLATHGRTTKKTAGAFPASDAGAADAAIADVAKRTGLAADTLKADAPRAYWYDATLGGAKGDGVAVPTYQVTVHGKKLNDKWTEVVKAGTRDVVTSWSEVREANRDVCDADHKVVSGSTASVRCGTAFDVTRKEGGAESSVADVNNVYTFFGQASDFYQKYVNVDLTSLIGADYSDGTGKALRGTVRICVDGECPFANAFWDGEQMAFGEGVTTDDITGHELTHGVTQHTSGLSGGQADSINEGLSDVFGKFIGITSNDPNDTGDNRWLLGAGSSLGAIRNMKDPRSSLTPQPDMVNGPGWDTNNPDEHINDGVVNKADYLITDGDTFNGQTVRGLGLDKSVQIWWGVENTLTQSATFKDVGDALNSSCAALAKAGTAGITTDDCTQVGNAVKATQLDQDPK